MSEQFFYPAFNLLPKRGAVTVTVSKAQEVVLEVPHKLIEDWKRENPEQPDVPAYEVDVPTWLEERHPIMNARACDHHDNGIRAWVIKASDDSPSNQSVGRG